jgi:hypothetical protein
MSARVAHLYIRPSLAIPLTSGEQDARVRLAAQAIGLPVGGIWREKPLTARQRRRELPLRSFLLGRLNHDITILVADIATLGRSLPDLIATLARAEARGATVLIATDDLGAVRSVSAVDLEAARQAYAREAIVEGRANARARGVKFGRPAISTTKAQAVQDAFTRGLGVRAHPGSSDSC